jgi:hypothetical protein
LFSLCSYRERGLDGQWISRQPISEADLPGFTAKSAAKVSSGMQHASLPVMTAATFSRLREEPRPLALQLSALFPDRGVA